MTSRQFTEWLAYAEVEPFGELRGDYRMAHALACLLNFLQGADKPLIQPIDLMPQIGAADGEQAEAEEDGQTEDAPPKHPNVLLFERMVGL